MKKENIKVENAQKNLRVVPKPQGYQGQSVIRSRCLMYYYNKTHSSTKD